MGIFALALAFGVGFFVLYLLWKYLTIWQFVLCIAVLMLISLAWEKIEKSRRENESATVKVIRNLL